MAFLSRTSEEVIILEVFGYFYAITVMICDILQTIIVAVISKRKLLNFFLDAFDKYRLI